MRLDKFLTTAHLGMRYEVAQFIKEGKVKVNGKVVTVPETQIDEEQDEVRYLGQIVGNIEKVYYMFHKPAGCITARKDLEKKTVLDYFHQVDVSSIFPVGRLDKDTEGLLFLTNDGEFDHQLMSPKQHVDKTYYFWAFGSLSEEQISRLENGISIGKEEALTKPAQLRIEKTGLYKEHAQELVPLMTKSIKMDEERQQVVSGYLTISEGRKHQVKRMLKAMGCYIVYLKRMSIGNITLDAGLQKGEYRRMTREEVEGLLNGK